MKSYDAIVIGAGAIGSSVAYHLAKKGMKVAVVERSDLASGTSSGCDASALICDKKPGIDTKLGYESIQLYKKYAQEFSYDFEFHQRGSIYVCESEEELEVARGYAAAEAADGYPMRMMDSYELKEAEPNLAQDLVGGIWTECDSSVTPFRVAFGFIEEGKKLGLEVFPYEEVTEVKMDGGAVSGVVTTGRELRGKYVVNCCGAWAPFVGKMVGLDIPIKPRKGQILVTEKTDLLVKEKIQEFGYMLSKFEDVKYERKVSRRVEEHNVAFVIEPTPAQNMIIGSNRSFDGYDKRNTPGAMKALAERAIRFIPKIKDVNIIRAYAGLRPYSIDHLPIVSAVEGLPGCFIAAGHEGDGICMAPITGYLMSQVITGETPMFDIDRLRFDRFRDEAYLKTVAEAYES
ncbi:MAG: FAD-dependent oxidoreductase [Bacillota bacterium]|nr:FAD-dependent oxidoreductase [Bacillota bacterium]